MSRRNSGVCDSPQGQRNSGVWHKNSPLTYDLVLTVGGLRDKLKAVILSIESYNYGDISAFTPGSRHCKPPKRATLPSRSFFCLQVTLLHFYDCIVTSILTSLVFNPICCNLKADICKPSHKLQYTHHEFQSASKKLTFFSLNLCLIIAITRL
jgi:hypothetical protein